MCTNSRDLFEREECAHRFTSVAGHVCAIDFPERFQDWELDPKLLFDCATEKKVTAGRVRGEFRTRSENVRRFSAVVRLRQKEKMYVLKSWMRSFHECEEEEACETSTAQSLAISKSKRRERDEKFSETE